MKTLFGALASLRLTVVLLIVSIFFIFAGTLAQNRIGLYAAQRDYFGSYFVMIPLNIFFPHGASIPGAIPFPGGITLGAVILLNLLCSQIKGIRPSVKTFGMLLIHLGLLTLIVGVAVATWISPRGMIALGKGMTTTYFTDERQCELAMIEELPDGADRLTVVRGSALQNEGLVDDPSLPCSIRVERFYPNAMLSLNRGEKLADSGEAKDVLVQEIPEPRDGNLPAAVVQFYSRGVSLGTYLLSTLLDEHQTLKIDGKTFYIQLRKARHYLPYSIQMVDFKAERYPGTEIPKSFSSLVRIIDPARSVDRQVLIEMNTPRRHQGITFYQSSMDERAKLSGLEAVETHGRWLPYVVSGLGGLGLLLHYCVMLYQYLSREKGLLAPTAGWTLSPGTRLGAILGVVVATICVMGFRMGSRPEVVNGIDLDAFGKLPILHMGRVQPLDTLARNVMKAARGKETAIVEDKTVPATQWLLDAWTLNPRLPNYQTFRIDNPQILDIFGLPHNRKYFSIQDLQGGWEKFLEQQQVATSLEPEMLDATQREILDQAKRFSQLWALLDPHELMLSAPLSSGEKWGTLHDAEARDAAPGAAVRLERMFKAYVDGDAAGFNRETADYRKALDASLSREASRAEFEASLNRLAPFKQSMALYVMSFVLAALSWCFAPRVLRGMAIVLLLAGLGLHSYGILARIIISGRPPVINLPSSAIFIGWMSVILGLCVEFIRKNGMGIALGCVVAFPTLLIADRLSMEKDSLAVLVAVLDTNFWLTTHVVIIAIGYSATLLAAALGIQHIFRWIFKPHWNDDWSQSHARLIYGITAFALINSFIGTVLGGVWADQSWGRFWGWDPKENGAAMIVLANALLLHVKRTGLSGPRGIAALSVFGGIVTCWSWFGTNLLSVGLHNYGFTSGAALALGATALAMTFIMVLPYGISLFSGVDKPANQ